MNTVQNKIAAASGGKESFIWRKILFRLKIALCIMVLMLIFGNSQMLGQGVGISEVSIAPDGTSILELRSSMRGFLAPRMTTAERLAIATPAQGLLVYDKDTRTFWYYDLGWKAIAAEYLGLGQANQILGVNATGTANEYKTLSGTTNQINVVHTPGLIQLSTPQDIATNSAVTFGSLTLSTPLAVTSGGTGLISGISGGIPYFITNTTMASSALLTANGLVIGGGAGTAPLTLAVGPSNTVLHGTGSTPSFSQVINPDIADNAVTTEKILNGTISNIDLDKINISLSGFGSATASVNLGNQLIINLLDPVNPQDGATKNYVDNAVNVDNNLSEGHIWVGDATGNQSSVDASGLGYMLVGDGTTVNSVDITGDIDVSDDGIVTIQPDAVTGAEILDNTITASDIATGAVESDEILDGTIMNVDVNTNAGISISKLAYGSDAQIIVGSATGVPTYVDMSGDVTIDNTGLTVISANAVGTLEIADNSITNAKMADNAIGNAEMLDNAIGNAELQNDAVTTVEIAPNTIVAGDIATGAVTTDEILDLTIVNEDVSLTAGILGTKILPDFGNQNVLTTGTLSAGTTTVTGNILVTGTVDGREVSTDGTNQDALQTLSGVIAGSVDLGIFTGTTISDNSTVKVALQQLETAAETGLAIGLTEAYINGNDLVTSGGNNVIISGTEALEITAAGGLIANTAEINGGTIDNTVIGSTTPAAATVTDLTATGTVNLGNDAIQANEIEDGAVTSAKILDGEIVNADINAAAAIALSKLANGSDAQIIVGSATGVPTYVDMSGDVTIDNTGLTVISANAVGTLEIADNSITNAKMADNAIGNAEMLDNAIGNAELQNDAVTTVEIAPNTIVAGDIATGAVTTDEILDLTIVNEDVSLTAGILGTKILPDFGNQNVLTTGTLSAGTTTVTGNILVTGTVDGREVSTDGTNQDALQTLSGVIAGSVDLGIFTGTTISDNSTVKVALQQLETAAETGLAIGLTEAYINGNDLVTSGGNNVIISGTEALEITAAGGLIANTAEINGGTIDNTVIGSTTPAAATVTDLTATGTVNLGNDAIQANEIEDGAVTSAKILDGEIVNADINAAAAIALSKLANGSDAQIIVGSATGVPTYVDMSGDVTIDNTGLTVISANAVGTLEIADNSITNAKMADNAIGNAEMLDNAIGNAELQNDAVTTVEIAPNTIVAGDIATGAVTTDEILDLTIVNEDVSLTAGILGTKILPDFGNQNVLTTGTLSAGTTTVTGNILVTGTVDGREVSTDGTNQDALQTLSGVIAGSVDLGIFTGTTISDNSTVKVALQQLETAAETGLAIGLTEAYINGNDLVTSGGNNVIISGTEALEITAAGGLIANTAEINGGTIDNTVIGSTTPAAATVTDLTATGTVNLGNDAIQANEIEDGAVTSAKILDGEIVNADINAAAAIALSKLANGSDAQIIVGSATGVPTYVDMSGDVTIDNTGLTVISANAVGTLEIADNSITNAKMADNAIGNAEMLDNAIGNAELQNDAVTTVEIAPNTIVAGDIATGAVTTDEILDLTIVNEDVSLTAGILGTKILPDFGNQNVLTTGTLSAGTTTVTGNILVTGTVDGREVSTDGTNQDALQTLSGVIAGSVDLGIFTGTTISDNSTVKVALQQLETAAETGLAIGLTEAYINGNDLVTSGGNNVIISGTEALEITAAGGLIANTAEINGGTIDNTVIGSTTPAAATVTDLTATGTVNLGNDAIQANEIEDGAVTSAKILDGEIVNADINAAAAIALSKLANGSDAQIIVGSATGVPTYVDMSGDVTIDNTGLTVISANAVGTLEIADNSITNAKMADNAIGNAEMLDNAIGNAELQNDAVTTVEIAPNTIVAGDIATGAVTTDEILDLTIVNEDVSLTAGILGTKILPDFGNQNVLTTGTLSAGTTTVTGNILVTGTVDGREVSTDGTNQDALQTLSGVIAGSVDLGIFTGTTISDNSTVKVALQQLETAAETGLAIGLTEAYINGNDLVTSGGNNVIISGTEALEITAAGGLIANTAEINGGTIDNTVIGSTTPAAATVTDLTATGTVNLGNDAIQANEIEDGAVTSAKILDGEIVNADINAAAAIALSKLANGSDAQIIVGSATGVPTYVDMSGDVTIDNTGLTVISANAVGTLEIADNSITNAKMADNAIGNAEMLDNAIGNAEMADNAVNTNELVNGAVTTLKILDANVTASKLTAGAGTAGRVGVADAAGIVTYGNVPTASITGSNLTSTDLTVTGGTGATLTAVTLDIANNAVTNAKMADNAIGNAEMLDNAIGNAEMADNAVNTNELVNNAITNTKMADNAIGNAEMLDNAIGNAEMADNAVNTNELVNSAVTTLKILDANVTASKLTAGAGTAGRVGVADAAGIVTYGNVPTASITGSNLTSTDLTVTGGTGATLTAVTLDITNKAVTLTKMADMATGSLIYRKTAGLGAPEVQSLATLKTDLGLTGTNTGDISLGVIGTLPNVNGASLAGQVLTLQPADGANGGVLTAAAQTIGGAKTWSALGTFNLGLNASGATVNLNAGSNFATNINTGVSTGALTLGNTGNTIAVSGIISGENPLVFEGATDNAFETTFAITDPTNDRTITFPNASGIVALENAGASWVVSGNLGTDPANNFIGTTDNKDLVFKANNTEVARLETGTGYLKMGDANSGTIRATKELVLREDGDQFGTSLLRLRNRIGENGAIFETTNPADPLVDFIFRTAGPVQRNIRFEARTDYARTGAPSFEIAGSNPDYPTLSLGDNYAAFAKPLYIGIINTAPDEPYPTPTALVQLAPGTATAGTAPLKFTSGPILTTPENGAVEYNGQNYFVTSGDAQYIIAKTLTATQSLSFGSVGAYSSTELTITVNGAADGDAVVLGIPGASSNASTTFVARVSGANTVAVKCINYSGAPVTPAEGTFRVSVLKY